MMGKIGKAAAAGVGVVLLTQYVAPKLPEGMAVAGIDLRPYATATAALLVLFMLPVATVKPAA